MATTTDTAILRGGELLLQASDASSVFTPERLTEEHRLIGRTAQEFVDNEILPQLDRLEQKTGRWRGRWSRLAPNSGCSASMCRKPMAGSVSTRSPRSSSARS